jgi:hypothetical protein
LNELLGFAIRISDLACHCSKDTATLAPTPTLSNGGSDRSNDETNPRESKYGRDDNPSTLISYNGYQEVTYSRQTI